MKNYKNLVVFDHPLIRHKIAILRDEKTSMKEFRELVEEITTLMTYESLKEGVPTTEIEVKTPLETCKQTVVKDNANLFTVSVILIAGIGGMSMSIGKVTLTSIACALILGIFVNIILVFIAGN